MRLYLYMSLSENTDDDINKFRSFSINLVEDKTDNIKIVERLLNRYKFDTLTVKLIETANRELKSIYRGKYFFDLCSEDQGIDINTDVMRIDKVKQKRIKDKWFEFNDKLTEIQLDFEQTIRKS